jgi:hypothetical protein
MEYRVTIAISEADEAPLMAILDSLERAVPEMGPVMGENLADGPTEYLLALDAVDALAACVEAVGVFRSSIAGCDTVAAADTVIVDLHAERVPDWELQERSELQTA